MITIDLQNIFATKIITSENVTDYTNNLNKDLKNLMAKKQGFYDLPYANISEVKNTVGGIKKDFSYFVLLGIGGSALGASFLKDALTNNNNFHILDNVDPDMIKEVEEKIELSKTLFIVISKSGGTPETVAQYGYFKKKILDQHLKLQKHFVFVTDPKIGFLRKEGEKQNIKTFDVPENVGGRFSVLSNVGIIPALLLEIDVDNLLKGARDMTTIFTSENFAENIMYQFAVSQFLLFKKGIFISVLMPYANKLKTLGGWYSQLLAESIGKNVNTGITPVPSIGVTDQHSLVQLFAEGPNDKLVTFVEVNKFGSDIVIEKVDSAEHQFLENISFAKLLNAELQGTKESLTTFGKSNATITIEKIDAYHIGMLIMFFEGVVAYLGELLGVDAFNQPGVELGKKLTKKHLM